MSRRYNLHVPNGITPAQGAPILIRHRKHILALALGLAIGMVAACPVSATSALDPERYTPEELLLAQRALEDSTPPAPAMKPAAPPLGSIGTAAEMPQGHPARKPGVGVLLSLVVPGAGHLYAGESRGWVNIGLDVASWASYFHYRDLGKAKEDAFEDYADAHWDYQRWLDKGSLAGCPECSPGTPEDSLILAFRDRNKQHYYEDIGKIKTYFYGWDDWAATDPATDPAAGESSNRRFYRGMRNHSNNFLKNSRYSFTAAMVNRVVSAVDVFRMLKRRAMPQLDRDTHLRFHLRTKPFSEETRFGFVITRRM